MPPLSTELRRQLERTVTAARKAAEAGARKALEALGVQEPEPYAHLNGEQRLLRRALRAQARQSGDDVDRSKAGRYEIYHLTEKCAYDHWHRMLFARFLAENQLLIAPQGVPVTLEDCRDLAREGLGKDSWDVAEKFAAAILPQIFRPDDPAGKLEFAPEDRVVLHDLVQSLPVATFTATDSLGWVYQFWQAERKDEVNAAGNKIGADELPSVTQLFTEDYMVDFLLDNTLGAWHAARRMEVQNSMFKIENCPTEDAARAACALPGCAWKYLRFIKKTVDGSEIWTPAAGEFSGWPKTAKNIKCLDPCMGSGHFVVAMFERLVALRVAEEKLDEQKTVAAVIRDNLFGLEIDPRCTQIGAFNLALAAWRRAGYCPLPAMNLACSGLAPNSREVDWLKLAGDDQKLQRGMAQLYQMFQKAAVLGSLINPRAGEGDLLVAAFHELQPLLEKALAQEAKDDTAHEMAVIARGQAKAAEILAGQFTFVATNVPYLGRGKQDDVLKDYCERVHSQAKADLATCFVERSLDFCARGGSTALVTPQNWWFLGSYKAVRDNLLIRFTLDFIVTLGEEAWQSFGDRGPVAALMIVQTTAPTDGHEMAALDALPKRTIIEKAIEMREGAVRLLTQTGQHGNPDHRIIVDAPIFGPLLQTCADSFQGVSPADFSHFGRSFWEISVGKEWRFWQSTVEDTTLYGGRSLVLWWNGDLLHAVKEGQAFIRGEKAWGKSGVACRQMRNLSCTLYTGDVFDTNAAVIVPFQQSQVPALWAFCSSPEFRETVRRIDKKLNVTNASFVKVPFDLAHWQSVAAEKYPHGLPKPFSSDPTQWLFNGHPKDSEQPLQVAVARLLGYRWPRQTGSSFPDCPALGADGLEQLVDDDGIVCIPAVRNEAPAAERLRELLTSAYGKDWSSIKLDELLNSVDYAGENLESWLRNGFFEQHCRLFHNRPFIWHIWDGRRDGFSALVNYHLLDCANLEKLTYTYLGDWLTRQKAAVETGEEGSDARHQAAQELKAKLEHILKGETPFDVFVRWKSIEQQPLGWNPDLNDGVRLNIRPFMEANILKKRPNIKWGTDRGKNPPGSPWGEDRDNNKHLALKEKQEVRAKAEKKK